MNQGDAVDGSVVNGWALFGHRVFNDALSSLVGEIDRLVKSDPQGFHHHPSYKLLVKTTDCAFKRVPANPESRDFVGGKAFKGRSHWRRAKHGMPPRYRLFFQFRSDAPKRIIYAWFNDEAHLRKEGARTDCYETFARMMNRGTIPNSFDELLAESKSVKKKSVSDPESQ